MKTLLTLLLLTAAQGTAAPLLSIASPDLPGQPGQSVTWQLQILPDPVQYVTFTATVLIIESNPALGIYSDELGLVGGPFHSALAPSLDLWTTTLGSYLIAGPAGQSNAMTVRVLWEAYSGDPYYCDACFASSGFTDLNVSVSTESVPEPGSVVLVGVAGLALCLLRNRTAPGRR